MQVGDDVNSRDAAEDSLTPMEKLLKRLTLAMDQLVVDASHQGILDGTGGQGRFQTSECTNIKPSAR